MRKPRQNIQTIQDPKEKRVMRPFKFLLTFASYGDSDIECLQAALRRCTGIAAAVFIALAAASNALAAGGGVKATKALCLECHPKTAAMFEKQNLHKPVRDGRCTQCHNPHASSHTGLLADPGSALCFNCHPKSKFKAAVTHKPVEEGKCSSCHDPHASNAQFLLKDTGGKSCYACHPQEAMTKKKNVHPEVRKGNCTTCHSAHASANDGLLVKDRRAVCATCHGKSGDARQCSYEVAGSDCAGCHSPHSSDRKGLLKASLHKPFEERKCGACHGSQKYDIKPGVAMCIECHSSTLASFQKINSHLMPGNKNSCTSCHNPHASDEKSLFKGKGPKVCFQCHSDSRRHMENSAFTHPGLDKCSECHVAHGSNYRYFLSSGNETCSTDKCHPTQGTFTHPVGEKIIDPRSKAPMDCSTCHNPMGSPEHFILRFEKDRELCVQCHQV